jgi:hypothetical protein
MLPPALETRRENVGARMFLSSSPSNRRWFARASDEQVLAYALLIVLPNRQPPRPPPHREWLPFSRSTDRTVMAPTMTRPRRCSPRARLQFFDHGHRGRTGPGLTGYSPRMMHVGPQMVVVVTR